jgi:hypothetical protein
MRMMLTRGTWGNDIKYKAITGKWTAVGEGSMTRWSNEDRSWIDIKKLADERLPTQVHTVRYTALQFSREESRDWKSSFPVLTLQHNVDGGLCIKPSPNL